MAGRTIDLAAALATLEKRFPTISRIYLFGSRVYNTGSARSDIDLLVAFDGTIPAMPELGDEVYKVDPYLDAFVMAGGVATSAINGSHIAAPPGKELVEQLDAELIWEQGQWVGAQHRDQKTIDDWAPAPSVAIASAPPIKAIDVAPPCDYLIVAGLAKEHAALRKQLEAPKPWIPAGDGAPAFEVALLKTVRGRNKHIATAVSPRMGMAPIALTTRGLLDFLAPKLVVLVGMAGGIAREELELGDIVVPDAIVEYEAVKVGARGEESNGLITPVAAPAYRAMKEWPAEDWIGRISRQRSAPKAWRGWRRALRGSSAPQLEIRFDAPMACGQKVIADAERATALKAMHRKTASIDMESWGVAEACAYAATPTPFVVIKGITDFADGEKNDGWHDFCCEAAASLAAELIRQDVL